MHGSVERNEDLRAAPSRVTVVIPTRNRLGFLREAVASVKGQTLADRRLVIVDDASEDQTWPWIEAQGEGVLGVRLDTHSERSTARNRGLREVDTPFVLFLDDDDRLDPRALERLSRALERHPSATAAVGGYAFFDTSGRRRRGPHPKRSFERTVWPEVVFGWGSEPGRTLFRTAAVRAAGGFAAGLVVGEDRDLWLRISRCGPAVFVPDSVLDHRIHPGRWRPADSEAIADDSVRRHLHTLPPGERDLGERIVAAAEHYARARRAVADERPTDAAREVLRMRVAPLRVLSSPLVRPDLIGVASRAFGGSVLGRRGVNAVRNMKSRTRALAKREPWAVPSPQRLPTDAGGSDGRTEPS